MKIKQKCKSFAGGDGEVREVGWPCRQILFPVHILLTFPLFLTMAGGVDHYRAALIHLLSASSSLSALGLEGSNYIKLEE